MAILSIGTFTQPATAVNQIIAVPSNLDYLRVYNYTQIAASSANMAFGYWTRSQLAGANPTTMMAQIGTGGWDVTVAGAAVLYDASVTTPIGPIAITNISATTGVVLTGTTTGLAVGSIIRLSNLSVAAAQELGGIDFSVSAVNPGVSFTIEGYQGATVPVNPTAAIGACTGFYTIRQPGLFYPKVRTISNIATINGQTVVSTTVNHGYQVGQTVRFEIPSVTATAYGITQLDKIIAIVEPANAANAPLQSNAFAINLPIGAFGAFAFPAAASVPFTPAIVNPFGDDSATALAQVPALSSLEDSVYNAGYLGMMLAAGAALPAGVAADVIYWEAGKVDFGGL